MNVLKTLLTGEQFLLIKLQNARQLHNISLDHLEVLALIQDARQSQDLNCFQINV